MVVSPAAAGPGLPSRRDVLRAGVGAAALCALPACAGGREIAGGIVGSSDARGHWLRDGPPPGPETPTEDVPVLVVGGGIAGLSAAWKLARSGFSDVRLLELEDGLGGTSVGGRNAVSPHPWGAHYVPVPTREERALTELLLEVGAITGFDAAGRALAHPDHLCRAPEERLFAAGRWHEGLFPRELCAAEDLAQMDRFQARVAAYAARRDAEGRRAFAVPVARSSRDADLLALDGISMADWMAREGLTAPFLRWWVEYACRDDFGCLLETTSAWAGLHYFAARVAVPGDEPAAFLTWPEGNARLVKHLATSVEGRVTSGAVVTAVEGGPDRVVVRWIDAATRARRRTTAEHVICALPRYAARRVVRGLPDDGVAFRTSPWVVANLTLDVEPASPGFPTCWDNVVRESDALGYVVATHQTDRAERDTVWTWYRPFPEADTAAARRRVLATPWSGWRDQVLSDLGPAHHELERRIVSLDVMRWGHAMVRPEPGFLFGAARARAALPLGRVHFAAADLGGLPLFEEAQWAGVRAAEEVLAARGVAFASSL